MTAAFSLEAVQQTAASLVAGELALVRQIRQKIASSVYNLDLTNPIAFRGLAAASTALKLTQDVTRRALPIDKLETDAASYATRGQTRNARAFYAKIDKWFGMG